MSHFAMLIGAELRGAAQSLPAAEIRVQQGRSQHGMVVSDSPHASRVGRDILCARRQCSRRGRGDGLPQFKTTVEQLTGDFKHDVFKRANQGSAHSIWVDAASGEYLGVADYRRGGLAAGVEK